MSSNDSDLRDWIRSQTQPAFPQLLSDRSAHCLQGLYPAGILLSRLQIPAFLEGRTIRSNPVWPIPDLEKPNRKKLNTSTELLPQTFDQTSLGDEASDDKYHRLSDRASDIEREVERLESSIDRRFEAQDPLTGDDSNTVSQAHALLVFVTASLSEHPPDAPFSFALDDPETENLRWNLYAEFRGEEVSGAEVEMILSEESFPINISCDISYDQRERRPNIKLPISNATVYDVHSSSGIDIDVDDLLSNRERPCVAVSRYNCGISYLPTDATVIEVQRICRAYFEHLESKALKAGNTHALLCFRLHHLRAALRAYNLYGDLQGYARGLEKEFQAIMEGRSEVGAPAKTGRGVAMEDRIKAILNKLYEREYWHFSGRHEGKPKWKKIVQDLNEESPKLVRATGGSDSITPERVKEIIDGHDDLILDEIREIVGAPEPN